MNETTETLTAEQAIARIGLCCDDAVQAYRAARQALANDLQGNAWMDLRKAEDVKRLELVSQRAGVTRTDVLTEGAVKRCDLGQIRTNLLGLRDALAYEMSAPLDGASPEFYSVRPAELPSLMGHVDMGLYYQAGRQWYAALNQMIDWVRQALRSE